MGLVRAGLMGMAAAAMVCLNTGCSNKVKADRDNLLRQNQELQAQLAQRQAAQDSANNRPIGGDTVAMTETTQPAPAPAATETADPSADSVGEDMKVTKDVVRGTNKYGESTLTIASDVLFASGKATLKPSAKKALLKAVSIIKKEHAGADLRVEGYTDSTPVRTSTWDDNWDLGAARARTVALYLMQHGIAKSHLTIVSHADNDLKGSKAASRRVEIVVVR